MQTCFLYWYKPIAEELLWTFVEVLGKIWHRVPRAISATDNNTVATAYIAVAAFVISEHVVCICALHELGVLTETIHCVPLVI
jgi:hypothetical protein